MKKDLIPYYKQYKEKVDIFLNQEEKLLGHSIPATIGMRRKGIAIAEDKKNIYLIDSNNIVLIENEREGTETYMEDYTCKMRRTITGYYVLEQTGLARTIWPGKDDSYSRETWICGEYDENGCAVAAVDGKIDSSLWERIGIGKYPIEMGNGLVYYENTFYDIETLKPKFIISNKFIVEDIFKDGVCMLGFSCDNRRMIARIQNEQITGFIDIDNQERFFELIKEVDDVSLFNSRIIFDDDDDEEITNQRKKVSYALVDYIRKGYKERLKDYYKYYIIYPYNPDFDRKECLINRTISIEDFKNNNLSLNQDEVERLCKLHNLLIEDYNYYQNGLFVFRFAKHNYRYGISCVFYSDFMLLRSDDGIKSRYSFYDYNGAPISRVFESFISEPFRTNAFSQDRKGSIDFYNHFFVFNGGYLEIKGKEIIINETRIPEFIQEKQKSNQSSFFVKNNHYYIETIQYLESQKDYHYYNQHGDEIVLERVPINVKEYIPNILYDFSPWFDYNRNQFGGYDIIPKMINGKLCKPSDESFENSLELIREKRRELRQYNIKKAERIKTYFEGTDKEVVLYYIEYHPMAFCDENGNIKLQNNIPDLSFIMNNQ